MTNFCVEKRKEKKKKKKAAFSVNRPRFNIIGMKLVWICVNINIGNPIRVASILTLGVNNSISTRKLNINLEITSL